MASTEFVGGRLLFSGREQLLGEGRTEQGRGAVLALFRPKDFCCSQSPGSLLSLQGDAVPTGLTLGSQGWEMPGHSTAPGRGANIQLQGNLGVKSSTSLGLEQKPKPRPLPGSPISSSASSGKQRTSSVFLIGLKMRGRLYLLSGVHRPQVPPGLPPARPCSQ